MAIEARPSTGGPLVHVHLKVVPGASRAGLAGLYGDRWKSGKANKAVLALLAEALGVAVQQLRVVRGASNPLKTVAVAGVDVADVERRLLP